MARPQTYNYTPIVGRLGIVSDSELAREVGCSPERIRKLRTKRGIPKAPRDGRVFSRPKYDWNSVRHLLGVVPISDIAAVLGCNVTTVIAHYKARGIANTIRKPSAISRVTKRDLQTLDNREVAAKYNMHRCSVQNLRRRKGIPQALPKCLFCSDPVSECGASVCSSQLCRWKRRQLHVRFGRIIKRQSIPMYTRDFMELCAKIFELSYQIEKEESCRKA